jgi:succinoglycan biosynthesis protein ExoM
MHGKGTVPVHSRKPRLHVTIAVATYNRTDRLRELIPLLLDQIDRLHTAHPAEFAGRLLIVDNDPDGSAQRVCDHSGSPSVKHVIEPEPGISAVRNRALDESTESDLLAMLDDDERPDADWLEALLSTWRSTRAALVSGRVVVGYEGELDPWIEAGEFFRRRNVPTGSQISVASSNSWLLDLSQIRRLGVRFDPRFGLSGGEDTLFSRTVHARGGRMVWCAESIVTDRLPARRMTRRWVLGRVWSHGNCASLVDIELASSPLNRAERRLRSVAGGSGRVTLGGSRLVIGLMAGSQRHQAIGLRLVMRGAGMIAGAFGYAHQEYARPRAGYSRRE